MLKEQTYITISKSAFNHNAVFYKHIIGPSNKIAAVIKGNGYGHGLHQMALLCKENEYINVLCVAQLSQALAIQNCSKPTLVLGYSDTNPELAIKKNIHFMVDSIEYAQQFNDLGKRHSYQFPVHVKIDTGLSRMGVLASQAVVLLKQLRKLDYIQISGIFSHFAASDSNPEFTMHQYNQFNTILEELKDNNITIENIHMSNTVAITSVHYQPYFNFFRIGAGLYGFGPESSQLRPIMTWKTHITAIKIIPANSYVSYACIYQTTRITRIALLPIGYYDGYQFRFSNKTFVNINGFYAPVIGRIAMNVTIIDITDIDAHIGDEVIILGGEHSRIDAHNLAQIAEIKNVREVLTGINPEIQRIIIE
ncbi:MAG TPA: alanine racemase [Candidatus Babeliales bacterium]|nr:alanine racemase [Candidatus Babeliales bacterium]